MDLQLKINGTLIKSPSTFSVSRYNLTKSGRIASGKMTMDLVAKKRKLFLTYETLTTTEVNHILGLIDGDNMFFTVTWTEDSKEHSMIGYVGEIPKDLHSTGGTWIWKDVNFNLIEQ